MTLYYTDVTSMVHSFDRNNAFRAYDSGNVDLVHIWIGTCQSAIPAVNDDISVAYILVATLVTKFLDLQV